MEPADGHPTIQHCIRSFEPYLAANRRTEKPVIHISLNPHPDDVLTDEQLTAIGQEYMEKMGYGNQPYIIYRHEDIGRPHIHIVSLRIDELYKVGGASKSEWDAAKMNLDIRETSYKNL